MHDTLFQPLKLGAIEAKNRILMAPLTRGRSTQPGSIPNEMMATYYRQRAGAGLIISEATGISVEGLGWPAAPGIWSDEQVEGWKQVTKAVHEEGGLIVLQMWHMGRIVHPDFLGGKPPVSASATTAPGHAHTFEGRKDHQQARAATKEDIARIVEDYRKAAENAKRAGFDGVQLHAANGYLIDQFLRESSNRRTDQYGGSVENRTRLLKEVIEVVTSVWEPKRVGVRFGPFSNANDVSDSDPMALFSKAYSIAEEAGLGFLDIIEGQTGGPRDADDEKLAELRKHFTGVYVANNGFDRALAIKRVESGKADAIAFGRPFIGNPDLVTRLEKNAPLNESNKETWYGGGAEGYTDYPTLEEERA